MKKVLPVHKLTLKPLEIIAIWKLTLYMMRQSIQVCTKTECGRQPLKNLK